MVKAIEALILVDIMSRLIFFLESYTAGGADQVARIIVDHVNAEKIFLVVNRNIDRRIIFEKPFGDHVSTHVYWIITPMDIGLYANKYKRNSFFYFIVKVIDYTVRYPLLIFSFFYFFFFMLRFKATHFFAHNGGYPGGLYCGTATMAAALLPTVKHVFFAFHSMPRSINKTTYWLDVIWDKLLDRYCNLISVSRTASDQLTKARSFKQKPICIYNGLTSRSCKPYRKSATLRLLHIGYFDYNKNQMMLVKTLSLLLSKGIRNISVTFVGDIDELAARKEIDEYVGSQGISQYISFTGFQKDVDPYYMSNDILICTSKIESFPLAILEAMRVGMPVISTNVGGIKEQITEGVNGYLINVNDVEALAKRVVFFYEDWSKVELMGKASFEIFEKNFSLAKMVSEYEKALKL